MFSIIVVPFISANFKCKRYVIIVMPDKILMAACGELGSRASQ